MCDEYFKKPLISRQLTQDTGATPAAEPIPVPVQTQMPGVEQWNWRVPDMPALLPRAGESTVPVAEMQPVPVQKLVKQVARQKDGTQAPPQLPQSIRAARPKRPLSPNPITTGLMQAGEAEQEKKKQRRADDQLKQQEQSHTLAELLPSKVSFFLKQMYFYRVGWPVYNLQQPLIGSNGNSPFTWLNGNLLTDSEKALLLCRLGSVTGMMRPIYNDWFPILQCKFQCENAKFSLKRNIESIKLCFKLTPGSEMHMKELIDAETKQDIGCEDLRRILYSRYAYLEKKYGSNFVKLKKLTKIKINVHSEEINIDLEDVQVDFQLIQDITGLLDLQNPQDNKLFQTIKSMAAYSREHDIPVNKNKKRYINPRMSYVEASIPWGFLKYQRPEKLVTPLQPGEHYESDEQ